LNKLTGTTPPLVPACGDEQTDEIKYFIRKELLGAGCLLSCPEIFVSRAALLDSGEIGHVQLMIIPLSGREFESSLQIFETYEGMIRIHAPHHVQGVNPADPGLYLHEPQEMENYIENAMCQTYEAADRTHSKIIILHAGMFRAGHQDEAIMNFHSFLDTYPDDRYVLESLPTLVQGHRFLGTTPVELKTLGEGRVLGYCVDFPHLWCTSCALGRSYADLLMEMSAMPIRFSHISGSPGPDDDRQHLLFDDPANRFPIDSIKPFFLSHADLEVSLEFAVDDVDIIRRQLAMVSSL
jgi:hypothetical protein